MPTAWKLVSMMPVAAIPARKYCRKPTPGDTSSLPKTEPKITSITTG
jgi:hypothetical protein